MNKINITCLSIEGPTQNNNNNAHNLFSPHFTDDVCQINEQTNKTIDKYYVNELKDRLHKELESSILQTKESPNYIVDPVYYDFKVQCIEIWQYVLEVYCHDLTSRQLFAVYSCIDSYVRNCGPDERRRIIVQRLASMPAPFEYDVNDQFIRLIANSTTFEFNQLIELLLCSEAIKYCCFVKRDNRIYSLKVQESSISVFAHPDNDEKYVYTILSCPTNPNIIADDSSFVKESSSELFIIENGRSYFRTLDHTMDDEIIKLSQNHPEDIFFTQIYCESLAENTYSSVEFYNGVRREFKIQHGCQFLWISPFDVPDEKDYSDFKKEVVLFTMSKNSRNGNDTIKSGTSNANAKNYYCVNRNTLIWENDLYRWTATQNAFCYFSTSVEIKEKKLQNWCQRIRKNEEDVVGKFNPIEVKEFHYDKVDQIDLTDLFMESYCLYANGHHYPYIPEDKAILHELYSDYVVKNDLDMIIDKNVDMPNTINDVFAITCHELLTTLSREYPAFSRRINVTAVRKLMREKGFDCERLGKSRTQCFLINKNSKIIGLISDNANSWHLLLENQLNNIKKNKINN